MCWWAPGKLWVSTLSVAIGDFLWSNREPFSYTRIGSKFSAICFVHGPWPIISAFGRTFTAFGRAFVDATWHHLAPDAASKGQQRAQRLVHQEETDTGTGHDRSTNGEPVQLTTRTGEGVQGSWG